MALHPCCQPASIGSRRVTHQPGDSVAELSGGTGRQCRGAVRRHWDSGAELFGTEAVRGGPDHRASPTLVADLQQLQQQDPVLGPAPAAWSAKPSNTEGHSTRALVQQYPRWLLNSGSSVMGRLTNVMVPLDS